MQASTYSTSTNKRNENDDLVSDDSASEGEDERPSTQNKSRTRDASYDRLEQLKREKRLAQNRDCARARRRRKKMRMELLEDRVGVLAQANQQLQGHNDQLLLRVAQLEQELIVLVASRTDKGTAAAAAAAAAKTNTNSSALGAAGREGLAAAFANPFAAARASTASNALAEWELQRRAALMAGLSHTNTNSNTAATADQLRYLELIQKAAAAGQFHSCSSSSTAASDGRSGTNHLTAMALMSSSSAARPLSPGSSNVNVNVGGSRGPTTTLLRDMLY